MLSTDCCTSLVLMRRSVVGVLASSFDLQGLQDVLMLICRSLAKTRFALTARLADLTTKAASILAAFHLAHVYNLVSFPDLVDAVLAQFALLMQASLQVSISEQGFRISFFDRDLQQSRQWAFSSQNPDHSLLSEVSYHAKSLACTETVCAQPQQFVYS